MNHYFNHQQRIFKYKTCAFSLLFILSVFSIFTIFFADSCYLDVYAFSKTETIRNFTVSDKSAKDNASKNSAPAELSSLHAKAAILMDGDNQRVLFGKEEEKELPMASTTKIMTCLYAIEHGNLSDKVTFSRKAASAPKVRLGARSGSQFLLSDLLYALMLESYNDVAVAIAEHIGGSVEQFCGDMTQEARDYGCYHTSFETPNGLDSAKHYTTCHDLALLTCLALKNENFCKIIKEQSFSIKELKNGQSYSLNNKNLFLTSYNGAIGVTTGYRTESYEGLHNMYKKTRSEGFGPEVKRRIMLGSFVLSSGYYDAYYLKALRTKALIKQAFDKAFAKYDVILGPAAPTTAPKLGESLSDPIKMYLGDIYTISVNLAGLPGISVPGSLDSKGLPIGIQFIGDCFKEKNIIRAAYAFEQSREFTNWSLSGKEEK